MKQLQQVSWQAPPGACISPLPRDSCSRPRTRRRSRASSLPSPRPYGNERGCDGKGSSTSQLFSPDETPGKGVGHRAELHHERRDVAAEVVLAAGGLARRHLEPVRFELALEGCRGVRQSVVHVRNNAVRAHILRLRMGVRLSPSILCSAKCSRKQSVILTSGSGEFK